MLSGRRPRRVCGARHLAPNVCGRQRLAQWCRCGSPGPRGPVLRRRFQVMRVPFAELRSTRRASERPTACASATPLVFRTRYRHVCAGGNSRNGACQTPQRARSPRQQPQPSQLPDRRHANACGVLRKVSVRPTPFWISGSMPGVWFVMTEPMITGRREPSGGTPQPTPSPQAGARAAEGREWEWIAVAVRDDRWRRFPQRH